jgi:hypothetical protein
MVRANKNYGSGISTMQKKTFHIRSANLTTEEQEVCIEEQREFE